MKYAKELQTIRTAMERAFETYGGAERHTRQKAAFDLVTDIDLNIERDLTEAIRASFPADTVLGEEFTADTPMRGRTWSVDPIDGTCNMANGLPLFGMQCALIEEGRPVLACIYLPFLQEWIWAAEGEGCYLGDVRVHAAADVETQNAMISFGDYPHKDDVLAAAQHAAVRKLYPNIAKIRMFGAACMDFSGVALGRTHGTVVITKNVWDIAPGILLCREAGAVVTDLRGGEYRFGADGVAVAANETLARMLADAFRTELRVETGAGTRTFDGCIFDFDGVILDSERYHYRAWRKAFAGVGAALSEEEYLDLRSTGRENVFAFLEHKIGRRLTADERRSLGSVKDEAYRAYAEHMGEADLIPGVRNLLERLRSMGVRTVVASSGKTTAELVARFGLAPLFDAVLDGNSPHPKKPAPDLFLAAAERIGVAPARCVVFEDSPAGVKAALAGGMAVVTVGALRAEKAIAGCRDFVEFSPRVH